MIGKFDPVYAGFASFVTLFLAVVVWFLISPANPCLTDSSARESPKCACGTPGQLPCPATSTPKPTANPTVAYKCGSPSYISKGDLPTIFECRKWATNEYGESGMETWYKQWSVNLGKAVDQ